MKLKTIYDTAEEIPEGYADLYTEKDGKWELTGIEGVKTSADVARVQEALRKEKSDHKGAKEKLAAFEGVDPEGFHALTTENETLKAENETLKAAGNGADETKVQALVDAKVRQAMGPVEREKSQLKAQLDKVEKTVAEKDGVVASLQTQIVSGDISRAVRDAAIEAKVQPTAMTDVVMRAGPVFERSEDGKILTKDGVDGTTPGLTPVEWIADLKEKAPHLWPVSQGGGARGANGQIIGGNKNPWSKAHWNVTEQGRVVKTVGIDKAKVMAESVGSSVGATKPPAPAEK